MTEIKKIIKKYQNNELCTCIDAKDAGGFWDLAGKYVDDSYTLPERQQYRDYLQQAYYDGLIAGSGIKEHDYNYCNLK